MNKQRTRSNRSALLRFIKATFMAGPLSALVLMTSLQGSQAGSAKWNLNPTSNDWYTATNWTPNTVPDGSTDTATFATSSQTAVSVGDPSDSTTELDGIVFNSGASAYTFSFVQPGDVLLSGVGITNDSRVTQTFVINSPLGIDFEFLNRATADISTSFVIGNSCSVAFHDDSGAGGPTAVFTASDGGNIEFHDNSSAQSGHFNLSGPGQISLNANTSGGSAIFTITSTQSSQSSVVFTDSAGADGAFFLNDDGTGNGSIGHFYDTSILGFGGFIVNGAPNGATNGVNTVIFDLNSSASGGQLVANAATSGSAPAGGVISFVGDSTGGQSQVQIFGDGTSDIRNGRLDISGHNAPGVTIGSLAGNGFVQLGANRLTVGDGNLSSVFSGLIQGSGSLAKNGGAQFTLTTANSYSGGTTVSKGTLLVTSLTGSATGTGPITVQGGTFAGIGRVSGAITVGTAARPGILAPGIAGKTGKLITTKGLAFAAQGVCQIDLDSQRIAGDQIVAKGVTINSGARVFIADIGTGVLASGTVFTIISNTARTFIAGKFSNLPDGTNFIVGNNSYVASYEGGDGNDLTLTVIP
jgi:autotransporter-associated beta strand protein